MPKNLLCLYPPSDEKRAITGLYLAHQIHKLGSAAAPFVYANFLSSLDGRIAVADVANNTPYTPKHLTTASDFQLFLELHAQADCLITHGGYMRALAEGRLGNILQIRDKRLVEWRLDNGLKPQPAVVIASASLDFPFHQSLYEHGQTVYIATGRNADPVRIRHWQTLGYPVLIAGGDHMVHAASLIGQLGGLGHKTVYLIAGPQMLHTMAQEKQLCRLYLTVTHQLIGGKDFRTLLTGDVLGPEGNLTLKSMYYEQDSPPSSGQFFMQFDLQQANSEPAA